MHTSYPAHLPGTMHHVVFPTILLLKKTSRCEVNISGQMNNVNTGYPNIRGYALVGTYQVCVWGGGITGMWVL